MPPAGSPAWATSSTPTRAESSTRSGRKRPPRSPQARASRRSSASTSRGAFSARRFTEARDVFSFFDSRYDAGNPPLDPVELDAYLVGLGGVGAAVIRTLAELGEHLSGLLR